MEERIIDIPIDEEIHTENTETAAHTDFSDDDAPAGNGGIRDIIAMQTAVCIITAIVILTVNILSPDTGTELLRIMKEHIFSGEDELKNPVILLLEAINK